jgi:hypothetical protein
VIPLGILHKWSAAKLLMEGRSVARVSKDYLRLLPSLLPLPRAQLVSGTLSKDLPGRMVAVRIPSHIQFTPLSPSTLSCHAAKVLSVGR